MKFTKENVDKIIAEAIRFKFENYDEIEYHNQLQKCTLINERSVHKMYCFQYHKKYRKAKSKELINAKA